MLMRALIVLLVVLNLGVAAWWYARDPAVPESIPEQPAGVARLELVKPSTAATPAATGGVPSVPVTCARLGPFPDRSSAEQASSRLGSGVVIARSREVPGPGASSYSVMLPPAESHEAALAMAQRIRDAGFNDLLVINDGADANGIALGRYRNRDSALRRQSGLTAVGFPAEIRASGPGATSQWWLDVGAAAAVSVTDLHTRSGTAQAEPLDCATVR